MLFADSLVVSLIPPVIDSVSPSFLLIFCPSSPLKFRPLSVNVFKDFS